MGFVSLYFLGFLILVFLAYYITPKKFRYIPLLVSSILFYVLCSWKSIFFILLASLIIYFCSRFISKNKAQEKEFLLNNTEIALEDKKAYKQKNKKTRKAYLLTGIISIIVILAIMKYLNFMIDNLNALIGIFDGTTKIGSVNWFLPLGISFYTFQAIGYITDIYWGKYEAEENFWKFLLFMSFFPKIMQGPIIRYNEICNDLFEGHDFDYDTFTDGLKRMVWGYFKKMAIADTLIVFTTIAFGESVSALTGAEAWLAIICYFAYDYCDFSGYMDIACGVSKCLGIKLPENFNHPYFAIAIDDYWRRWHTTLGTWFKDYVFYPLSVSKFSINLSKKSKNLLKKNANKVPAVFGLIFVWLLTGLWHGASWNYILWGLYFGLIIILNIVFEPLYEKIYSALKINKDSLPNNIFRHIRVLLLLAFGKILFETSSISNTFTFISRLFVTKQFFTVPNIQNCLGFPSVVVALCCSIVVLVIDIIQEAKPQTTFIEKTKKLPIWVQWTMLIVIIVAICWFGYYGQGLPKFEFGYMEF